MAFVDTTYAPTTRASLTYFDRLEKGVRAYAKVNADPITGKYDTNCTHSQHDVVIENVRGKEDAYTLKNAGFQYHLNSPSGHKSFSNDKVIEEEYYPESIELFKKLTGANRVVIFDHTVRRHRPGQTGDSPDKRQPVAQVHVDQTTKSAIARVHRHLPAEDVPALLEKRFQLVNLWRPINNPAWEWPLALCDYRSVDPAQDTLPVTLIYPETEGETYGITFNPAHEWKYLRGMTPEDVVLIKCFDSVQDGSIAVFTPHTGFIDPTTPPEAPLRESIELRALLFYD